MSNQIIQFQRKQVPILGTLESVEELDTGLTIKLLRLALFLTQEQLAHASGLTRDAIASYETQVERHTYDTVRKIIRGVNMHTHLSWNQFEEIALFASQPTIQTYKQRAKEQHVTLKTLVPGVIEKVTRYLIESNMSQQQGRAVR